MTRTSRNRFFQDLLHRSLGYLYIHLLLSFFYLFGCLVLRLLRVTENHSFLGLSQIREKYEIQDKRINETRRS